MAEKKATVDAFEDVEIDFGNLASSYSLAEDIVVIVNPIPRHKIADTDRVQLEKVFDGGTRVVTSVRPHYDEQSKRWKVRITASAVLEGPGTFRLSYAKGQGLVLATSRLFTITHSGPSLEVPPEDESNSQESLMSSFVTVSDQDEESFAAIINPTTDPTESSRLNEWEDLGAQLPGNTEDMSNNHQALWPSHATTTHQSSSPECTTSTTSTELIPHTNSADFQSLNKVWNEESSNFTYVPTASGEEHSIPSLCDEEEKSEEREPEETAVSHESQEFPSHVSGIPYTSPSDPVDKGSPEPPSHVSSIHHTSLSDPVATTTSGSCLGVPSLSQSVVLVDYISQAEAKAALGNNKEMVLKIAKLTKKITSERQLHQQVKDQLESCEKEVTHLREKLTSVLEEADDLRVQLKTRDHKIVDMEDGVKKLEADKQRYQQTARDLRNKLDSYRIEVHRLNQATKTYQTQMKLLHTENAVLRQRSTTVSNVAVVSSPPPQVHSPPKQHLVTGMTVAPAVRMGSNFPSHRQRERHQAEPRVQPSGFSTEPVYQPGFGFKRSDPSQREHDKESELRRTLMGDKEALMQCPVCNITMPAHSNQQTLALHVEACLKDKGYE